ncbi:MAG: tRNA (adenosine(37)-N6)-threonylcarbamoyltransferase complex dimerization subunit type 1 TsaB [Acidobacteria bacterium]|nr:tRNA (adenosine(37)-N6)-threonylcarbamoyltransferase complex dimerization subunit type 1 TsaB [Acidobacteriota bacterium]
MLVLALDTTTRAGSVALVRAGHTLEVVSGDPARPHAERLPGDVTSILARHGLGIGDVELFAVAAGPGSFTGLRIGIATMQGLAFATGRPVVGVSALEALAHSACQGRPADVAVRMGVWMDAQRGEVFSALYTTAGTPAGDAVRCLDEAAVETPQTGAMRWRSEFASGMFPLLGDGAVRYQETLRTVLGDMVSILEPGPIAPSVAALAEARGLAGDLGHPHAIRPIYVRRPDAELARDRRAPGAP